MDHDGRMGVCLDYTVNVHLLAQLAEPGNVGVASPKQKRYAMRTVFVLGRVDKKDANLFCILYLIFHQFHCITLGVV